MNGEIELDGVTKSYGSVVAVDEISLSVGGDQFHCLLGPNGSGKSTLFRLLLGLTRPSAGSVSVPDIVVGCGFQRPNFYPGLTVRENIHVFAGLVGATDWEWNNHVVEELRLRRALDRTAGELSGGFARKLDLALALVKKPDVLLLDEPLGALDDVSAARFLEFLRGYVDDGNSVLVSTHRVTAFEPYVDRVTVLHQGQIVFDRASEAIDLDEGESLQAYYVERVLEREDISPEKHPPVE